MDEHYICDMKDAAVRADDAIPVSRKRWLTWVGRGVLLVAVAVMLSGGTRNRCEPKEQNFITDERGFVVTDELGNFLSSWPERTFIECRLKPWTFRFWDEAPYFDAEFEGLPEFARPREWVSAITINR